MKRDDIEATREALAEVRRRHGIDMSIRDPRTPWTGNRKDRRAQDAAWRRRLKRVTVTVTVPAARS